MDTSKRIFQLHGVNEAEQPVLRKKLSRFAMGAFFERLEPAIVAMEACGASHHWARELTRMGHEVRLIAPQLVKPYVKRGKNDAADAEALCEAASRPTMRFVPVKTRDRQAALMLATARERLVRQLTQLVNAIRGHAAEFGITVPKGRVHIPELLALVKSDETIPALARGVFEGLEADLAHIEARLGGKAWRQGLEARLGGKACRGRCRIAGLVQRKPGGEASGQGPRDRPCHRVASGDEDARSARLPLGTGLCGMDRADAEGSLHRWQDQAGADHKGGRRDVAKLAGGGRHGRHLAN
jgi:transposase